MSYEWSLTKAEEGDPEQPAEGRALGKELQALFDFWESSLWDTGFFGARAEQLGNEDAHLAARSRAKAAMDKLRRLIMRSQPSVSELGLLQGALRSLSLPKKS